MSTSFKKTSIKVFPRYKEEKTEDSAYWKYLQFPASRKFHSAVTHLQFSPTEPNELAVTSSTRVEICSCRTAAPLKVMSRFNLEAHSGRYRQDGQLLVAGGEEGVLRVFEVSSKSLLRWFRAHSKAVHFADFTVDGRQIVSGADDGVVKVFDLATREEVQKSTQHTDYIRCGCICPSSPNLVITGSYDQTVKVLDVRSTQGVLSINHGAPVESVVMSPSGALLYTAGGPVVKVWDVLGGGRLLTRLHGHHKTVTSLALSHEGRRLLSAGLDRHVKIYECQSYKVAHTLECSGALLGVAIAPDDSAVAVGQTNGVFEVRLRREAEEIEEERTKKAQRRRHTEGAYRRREGVSFEPKKTDAVITHDSKPFLAKYDRMMKAFKYSKALDAAMEIRLRSRTPDVTFSVIQELIRRNGLKVALAGRTEASILDLLVFINKNINNPLFLGTIMDLCEIILELYKDLESQPIEKELKKLKTFLAQELEYIHRSMGVMGMLDTLLSLQSE